MKIAIVGRASFVPNYITYVKAAGFTPYVTLNPAASLNCDLLLLPGGGDINPAFYGQANHGSHCPDTELDILQLQALKLFVSAKKPVLGICKGMQLINVFFGGTLIQHLPTAFLHSQKNGDVCHITVCKKNSCLYSLYGANVCVNSAHHQALSTIGSGLELIQSCPVDNCPEAICHKTLPILGVQWHPERLSQGPATPSGESVLLYLASRNPSCSQSHSLCCLKDPAAPLPLPFQTGSG